MCPEGDFYKCLREGSAKVVTAHIRTFDAAGIELRPLSAEASRVAKICGEDASGAPPRLDADIIIMATGLSLQWGGGVHLSVDGEPVDVASRVMYRGLMLNDVP